MCGSPYILAAIKPLRKTVKTAHLTNSPVGITADLMIGEQEADENEEEAGDEEEDGEKEEEEEVNKAPYVPQLKLRPAQLLTSQLAS